VAGIIAVCKASCPNVIDLGCGFQVNLSSGTRPSTRLVIRASCSSSALNEVMPDFQPFRVIAQPSALVRARGAGLPLRMASRVSANRIPSLRPLFAEILQAIVDASEV